MTNTDNTTITTMRIPMISAADEATPIMTSIATGIIMICMSDNIITYHASHIIMKGCIFFLYNI